MSECRDNQEVGLEAATLERVRNSSLVKCSGAENSTGLKPSPEAADLNLKVQVVEEHCVSLRRSTVRTAGGIRSANADMSSVKGGEKPPRRKRKVSYATFIGVG